MVELFSQAQARFEKINPLAFYVAAPKVQIDSSVFAQQLSPVSIKAKVENRVKTYGGEKEKWFEEWFLPILAVMKIESIAWEDLVATAGPTYLDFYEQCVQLNKQNHRWILLSRLPSS
jgi:hypothetical protein